MKSRATKAGSSRAQALEQGRKAFRHKAWGSAFTNLSAADAASPLDPEHLVELAQTALLIGKEGEEQSCWHGRTRVS